MDRYAAAGKIEVAGAGVRRVGAFGRAKHTHVNGSTGLVVHRGRGEIVGSLQRGEREIGPAGNIDPRGCRRRSEGEGRSRR